MRTCLRKIGILAAAILFAALCMIGCKEVSRSDPVPETFTVEMKAGEHGTVSANPASGKVVKDTEITFTAVPESGYRVEKWTVTPESALIAEGKAGNTLAKVKITANTKVNVNFTNDLYTVTLESVDPAKKEAVIKAVSEITRSTLEDAKTLVESAPKVLKENITEAEADEIIAKIADAGGTASRPERYTVALTPGEHGTVTANPVIPASGKVDKDTEITFTADPATGYKVDKWTITPASALQEGGTAGSTTAKVKITAATTVNVGFTKEGYAVTFDAKGGTPVPAAQTVKYKEKATKPSPEPTKEGHTFDGWYNKAGDSPWNFAVNEVTQNTELYAKWRINTYPVTFGTPANGTLKAEIAGTVITSGKPVEYGKTVTFTAAPASDYKVDTWTITPASALQEGGTPGSTTAKVKITANTNVNVTFTSLYEPVAFGTNGTGLDTYLKNTALHTDGIYYIKVTGLTPADLKGDSSYPIGPSALGKILKDNPTKKVALKLEEIPGLTDMTACFLNCTNLIQAPVIPNGVTKMESCFYRCTSLTQAPVIPSGVTNMGGCFSGCRSLTHAPVIPNSVTDMEGCFESCTSLTQAPVIPSGVTDMERCFDSCTSLTQAPVIPSSVTNMTNCFYGCTSLTQAPVIPNSVTDMESCFYGCTSLTQAPDIPSSVTDMKSCFHSCTSLTQAPVIQNGVTDMESCFYGCTRLTQAPVIPNGVTVMLRCFYGCKNITAVTLKCNYVEHRFNLAFSGCNKLTAGSIKVPAAQLQTYRDNAYKMSAQSSWFIAE